MKTNLQSLIMLILLGVGFTLQAQEHTMLYRISGNELSEPSYVFGTIHIICPDDLMFSPELKASVAASEQLVFELDFDDPKLMSDLQAGIMLEEDQTLKSFYTDEEYARINEYTTENFGQPVDMLGTMKPFFLMSMIYPQILGCQPASMEMELMSLSDRSKTEVLGIESVQEQLNAIDALSLESQADMLLEAIEEFDAQQEELLEMVNMYKSGDVEKLYAYSSEEFGEYEGFDEIMLAGRNRKWIGRMETLMKEKPTFFGVGAAHLGGEEGVLQLLRNQGYEVTPILVTKGESGAGEEATADLGPVASQLLGEWKIDESLVDKIADDAIDQAVSQNPGMAEQITAQRDMIVNMVRNTVKEFKADGTYEVVVPSGGGTQRGTWRVDEEKKQLIEQDNQGVESVKAISELNQKILITLKEGEEPRKYLRIQ